MQDKSKQDYWIQELAKATTTEDVQAIERHALERRRAIEAILAKLETTPQTRSRRIALTDEHTMLKYGVRTKIQIRKQEMANTEESDLTRDDWKQATAQQESLIGFITLEQMVIDRREEIQGKLRDDTPPTDRKVLLKRIGLLNWAQTHIQIWRKTFEESRLEVRNDLEKENETLKAKLATAERRARLAFRLGRDDKRLEMDTWHSNRNDFLTRVSAAAGITQGTKTLPEFELRILEEVVLLRSAARAADAS